MIVRARDETHIKDLRPPDVNVASKEAVLSDDFQRWQQAWVDNSSNLRPEICSFQTTDASYIPLGVAQPEKVALPPAAFAFRYRTDGCIHNAGISQTALMLSTIQC